MSDTPEQSPATESAPSAPVSAPEDNSWTPPGSQDELNRIVQDRLARERSKYADYDTLREKAQYWDEIEAASKSEQERQAEALEAAEARYAAAQTRIVQAELRAALTGVVPDPGALIEDLNVSRFVNEDGEIDSNAIAALREKYSAFAPQSSRRMAPNPAQGTSAQPPLGINERIAEAEKAGDMKTAFRLKAAKAVGGNQ